MTTSFDIAIKYIDRNNISTGKYTLSVYRNKVTNEINQACNFHENNLVTREINISGIK